VNARALSDTAADGSSGWLGVVAVALLERNRQLQEALETRIVIEQAKGVLVERYRLEPAAAFELLRRAARTERVKVNLLAVEVVASRETPAAILNVLARRQASATAQTGVGSPPAAAER
jgi:hypothetical protein